jgi:hypothetical protein
MMKKFLELLSFFLVHWRMIVSVLSFLGILGAGGYYYLDDEVQVVKPEPGKEVIREIHHKTDCKPCRDYTDEQIRKHESGGLH